MKRFIVGVFFIYCEIFNTAHSTNLFPKNFTAIYELHRSGIAIAETQFRLEKKQQILFQSTTQLTGFASLLSNEKIIEKSMFEITEPASIKLINYQFKQTGDKTKDVSSTVNWQQRNISTIINKQAAISSAFDKPLWDTNSAFLALMNLAKTEKKTFSLNTLDEGKIVTYKFSFTGHKEIEYDEDEWVNTSIWKRVSSNKTLVFYLNSNEHYIPIKIEEYRNKKLRATLWLTELNWYE